MGKHAVAVEPGGRAAPLRLALARARRPRRPVSVWRFLAAYYPLFFACAFMDSTDVPWYVHPLLDGFGALLPLTVIGRLATTAANALGERRAGRLMRPRPRVTYLFMALGWSLAGGTTALLAWAAGAKPTGPGTGEDWIATGLVWATMISACATLMMIGRVLTSSGKAGGRWFPTASSTPPSTLSDAPVGPACRSGAGGRRSTGEMPDLVT